MMDLACIYDLLKDKDHKGRGCSKVLMDRALKDFPGETVDVMRDVIFNQNKYKKPYQSGCGDEITPFETTCTWKL